MSQALLLIDGDIVRYRAAFAAQARKTLLHTTDGKSIRFNRKWAAKEWAEKHKIEDYTLETVVADNDVGVAFYSVDSIMKTILQKCNSNVFRIFLTGSSNFRDAVAVSHKYKGNGDALDKPIHYEEVAEYMTDKWGAEVVEGMEADDALGIYQTNTSIIVTIDKDLDMIPGKHYNFVQDRHYEIDPFSADYLFYRQMLTGDSTDNIFGLKGIGEKRAENILNTCSYEEVWPTIYSLYVKEYGTQAYDRLVENGRLLYILREKGEHWSPPKEEELREKAQSLQE